MEVLLLVIIAALLIAIITSKSSKHQVLEKKLSSIEKYLDKILAQQKANLRTYEQLVRGQEKEEKPIKVVTDSLPSDEIVKEAVIVHPKEKVPEDIVEKQPEPVIQVKPVEVFADRKPSDLIKETSEEKVNKPKEELNTQENVVAEQVESVAPKQVVLGGIVLQTDQHDEEYKNKTETAPTKNKEVEVKEVTQPKEEPVLVFEAKKEKVRKEHAAPLVEKASENWYDAFRKRNPDIEKFIGENLVSKIGIAILVIGIAFFVKYAIDKNWINEVARVGIGILCGGIVLGFAHRLRLNFKAFSSVLVAGGISIFYFTIGIAFHQYHLFNQTTAFIIMLVITGFSVYISTAYDRVELAALSLIGGFATPLMVSTGGGNYQVLFSYILVLDVGMLVLAYMRKWNLINIMTYVFTMVLYFIWLQNRVIQKPSAPYAGALLFSSIFYIVFVLMNMINNVKEKREFKITELSVLISNTVLFYVSGMEVLYYFHPEYRGLFNMAIALFNLVCSWLLFKKFKADPKLVYLMIGITLTAITVAGPVQLDGNYVAVFWSVEGLMLMWLSQKSKIVLYRFASVVVSAISFIALVYQWNQTYGFHEPGSLTIIFNKGCITGLVTSLSFFGVSLLLKNEEEEISYLGINFTPKSYAIFTRAAFIILFYITGLLELFYQLEHSAFNEPSRYIFLEVYHLIYLCSFNILLRKRSQFIEQTILLFNCISVFIFVVGFAHLPIQDLKTSLLQTESNLTAFILHYVSLAALIFLINRVYNSLRNKTLFAIDERVKNVVLAIIVLYLSSIELVLHVEFLSLKNIVTSGNAPEAIRKLEEYETALRHVIKIGFPILWGLLAFVYLFIGLKKRVKMLRIIGLVLMAITLIKLFVYDIKQTSEAGKIIEFCILGVVLLVISFMYQKIKALLKDDKENETKP